MATQKWYQKATVQAALVGSVVSSITAIIAIIAIYFTSSAANEQLLFDKQQNKRDSINSVLQLQLLQRQLSLTNKTFYTDSILNFQQLQIATENLKIVLNEVKNQKTAKWGRLRNTMWEIMDLSICDSGVGYLGLEKLSQEEKVRRGIKIWDLLNSEIDNPVLIGNTKCLGYWRNAISKAKSLKDPGFYEIFKYTNQIKYSDYIGSLMTDVTQVWIELILKSSEISPTGGNPNKKYTPVIMSTRR